MTVPVSNPIAKELDERWNETQGIFQQWWFEADLDTKMACGMQDAQNNQFGLNNYRNQRALQFNKILRIINMIGGYQRDNRLATTVIPSDNDPDNGQTADQLTKLMSWIMRQDQTYEKISDCFDGSNICGLNLMRLWMDFREDPENGEIKTARVPFNAFLMDPYWTDPSLKKDCNWVWTRDYLTAPQLKSLIPGIAKDLPMLGKGYSAKDGKFQFLAQNWYQYQQQMFSYDEYWVRDYKTVRKVLDKSTGEVADWNGTREQFQLLRRFNPNVELIKASKPTVKLHVLVNNHLVYEEKSPYGLDRLPFAVSTCYHFPEVQNYGYRYMGVVRNIRDSQIELNRRRNRLLDILDAQIQSGLMVKEDALVNPEDAFFQGPGKVLYFKNTANLATDQMQFAPPPVGSGWLELIQTIEKEIMDIVGPEELFAQNMSAKDMSGVMMKLKMGAGLTGLRNIFDRLNQFQTYTSDIMLEMALNNFGAGKIAHVIGEEPTDLIKQVISPENQLMQAAATMLKFNCAVEEQEMTSTQRQLQFLQALQMKQIGIPISNKYILEKSTLQGKKEVIDDIMQQEQQAQQMQQQQFQAQMEQSQVVSRSVEAKAQSDFAAAEEKKARAVSDIALAKERSSQAMHDRASAALENTKALKELEEMDENRLIKLSQFILDLQERQKAIQGGEEADAIVEADAISEPVKKNEQQSKPSSLAESMR